MRRTHRTVAPRAALVPLALFVLVGCFSTISPDVEDPTEHPDDDPNVALVRGLTMHKFATGDIHRRSDWSVEVRWYTGSPTLEDEIRRDVVRSDNNAVYESSETDRRVTHVAVRPLLCSFDPNDPRWECCIGTAPSCPCPDTWGAWRILDVGPGVHHNEINLVVNCSGS